MARRLSDRAARRRVGWLLLVLGVLLAHALVTRELAQSRAEWGAAQSAPPPRLEVAFVRELVPTAPPPRAPAKPRQRKAVPAPVQAAASVPQEVASAPEPAPSQEPVLQAAASAPEAPVETASPPAPAASEPTAPAFEWPLSTQLKYRASGYYRGDIHGGAQVRWIRIGPRYQVHLDAWLGPPFAPLFSRRMTSDGELSDAGLKPRRYDEDTKMVFNSPRQATVRFEPDAIVLANGARRDAMPGAQDTASQFVQLTWLFLTQPQLLRTGNAVELPVALPRRVYLWTYEVIGEERLHTPLGDIDTFHVKPRIGAKGNDLTAEIWFAPTLQYLPVRILLRQGPETYLDLLLETRPTQAMQ
jgi:hypothetical protein